MQNDIIDMTSEEVARFEAVVSNLLQADRRMPSPSLRTNFDTNSIEIMYRLLIPPEFDTVTILNYIDAFLHDWNELPSRRHVQAFINAWQGGGNERDTRPSIVDFPVNMDIGVLPEELQTQFLVQATEYRPPTPTKLNKKQKKKFEKKLKTVYSRKRKRKDEDICTICQESVESGRMKKVMIKKCNHVFHKKCLEKWVSCKPNCPTCRVKII